MQTLDYCLPSVSLGCARVTGGVHLCEEPLYNEGLAHALPPPFFT
jgi:hypothetical protein